MGHYYIRNPKMPHDDRWPQSIRFHKGDGGRGRNSIYKHSCRVLAGFTAVQEEEKKCTTNKSEIFLTECFQIDKLHEMGGTHRWHMTKKNFRSSNNFNIFTDITSIFWLHKLSLYWIYYSLFTGSDIKNVKNVDVQQKFRPCGLHIIQNLVWKICRNATTT